VKTFRSTVVFSSKQGSIYNVTHYIFPTNIREPPLMDKMPIFINIVLDLYKISK